MDDSMKYRRRLSRNESCVQLRLSLHWWTLLHNLQLLAIRIGLVKLIATFVAICATLAILPIIALIYIGLQIWRSCVQLWVKYYLREDFIIHPITIQNTHSSHTPFSTLLISLKGAPTILDIREKIQNLLYLKDNLGKFVYPNLVCLLDELYGYYIWRKDVHFDMDNHVILAPYHYHGRSVSNRNIQEYLSELCSEPLSTATPPWRVFVIQGVDDELGDEVTWFVVRAHHLLVDDLSFHNLFMAKYPNLWESNDDSKYSTQSFRKGSIATSKLRDSNHNFLKSDKSIWSLDDNKNNIPKVKEKIARWDLEKDENVSSDFNVNSAIVGDRIPVSDDNNYIWNARKDADQIPIFSAPIATKKLLSATCDNIIQWLAIPFSKIREITECRLCSIVNKIYVIVNSFSVTLSYEIFYIKRQYNIFLRCMQVTDIISHLPFKLYKQIVSIVDILQPVEVFYSLIKLNILKLAFKVILWLCRWLFKGIRDIKNTKEEYKDLLKASWLEIYWIIRAMVSLPRLMIEELILISKARPITVWNRKTNKRQRNKLSMFWSEDVPLNSAFNVKGVTGASLSSVLLTATSGAVRDLIRACGVCPPSDIQCTLPLYSPTHKLRCSYGLLPLSLPTSKTSSSSALRHITSSLNKIREYPETYLASIWLTHHVMDFLPRFLRSLILKKLSAAHPVLLTNLLGPQEAVQLWGYDVTSIMFWRPPQHHAVVSVCVSSYCNNVSAGVVVDASQISCGRIIPQSFVTNINDLAIATGVKIERRSSKTFSRPTPTPPPTPNVKNHKFDFHLRKSDILLAIAERTSIADHTLNTSLESINSSETMESSSSSVDSNDSFYEENKKCISRRRKSDVSSNSWEIIKQTVKGL